VSLLREKQLKALVDDLLINVYQSIDREYGRPIIPQNEKFDAELEQKFTDMLYDTIRHDLWLNDSMEVASNTPCFSSTKTIVDSTPEETKNGDFELYVLTGDESNPKFTIKIVFLGKEIGLARLKIRENGSIFTISSTISDASDIIVENFNTHTFVSGVDFERKLNHILDRVVEKNCE